MATMQEQGHAEGGHPTPRTYVNVAIILSAITLIEVVVVIAGLTNIILIPVLLGLSAVKFVYVVGWFMHLKFDARLYQALFFGGLFLAIGVLMALVALFENFTLPGATVGH